MKLLKELVNISGVSYHSDAHWTHFGVRDVDAQDGGYLFGLQYLRKDWIRQLVGVPEL
jgi:hypothetical protein